MLLIGVTIWFKQGKLPWEIGFIPTDWNVPGWIPMESVHESTPLETTHVYLGSSQRKQSLPYPEIPAKLEEVWKSDPINVGVHTASKGSPAVDESGIYVGSDAGIFYAFNHDGSIRWRFRMGRQIQGIHGSPLLDRTRVFIGGYNGRLYCFRKSDGKLLWVNQIADAIGSSPAFIGNDLIVSAETDSVRNGYLLRIESATGRVKWRSPLFDEQVHSSPTVSPDGTKIYVGNNAGEFGIFDAENGTILQENYVQRPVKGTGVFHEGVVYFSSWAAGFYAIDANTGKRLWAALLLSKSQSSPLIIDNMAVIGSHSPGFLYGIDLKKKNVVWERLALGDVGGMSTAVGVRLRGRKGNFALAYCGTDLGMCILDPKNGKVVSNYRLENYFTGVPVVLEGKVYLALNRGPLLVLGSKH